MSKTHSNLLKGLCVLFSAAFSFSVNAQETDNITISKKIEKYEFEKGSSANPVVIKQKTETFFKCNGYRTSIPYAEFYNDKSSIDGVKIYVDGSKAKYIVPKYDYYEIDDVFYSDSRICYFTLPLEKKNSESEVDIEKTILDPRYFTSIYLTERYLTEHKDVTIVVPDWMQVTLKNLNFPKDGSITATSVHDDSKSKTIYTYTVTNLKAKKEEAHSPGPTYIYPHIMVLAKSATPSNTSITYFNTIEDQYNWYRSLISSIGNDDAVLKPIVKEITQNENTDADKIKAIFAWVQNNIRYVAFEDGIAGFKPQSAQEVYSKKYGDCKGMANLTKALLTNAGFDARLCWLGTKHIAYDYKTPSLSVDNHMICALKFDGSFVFLDATEKYIGYNEYAERIQGREVLIEDGDKCILEHVPLRKNIQNAESEKCYLTLDNTTLKGSVQQVLKGESKEWFLSGFNSIKKQDRSRAIEQYLSEGNTKYKIVDLEIHGLQNWNNDLNLKYNVQRADAVSEFGDEKYLEVDFRKEFMDLKMDSTRKNDYWFSYKYHIEHESEITLPAGFTAQQLPQAVSITRPGYSFNLQYALVKNKLVYKKELIIYNTILPASSFSEWNADIEKLHTFYLEQITLKKI